MASLLLKCRNTSFFSSFLRYYSGVKYPLELGTLSPNHESFYQESLKNPERFWGDLARQRVRWMKPFDHVMNCNMREANMKWFEGGQLNISGKTVDTCLSTHCLHVYWLTCTFITDNCLDRHVLKYPDRIALIWEKDEPNEYESITYRYNKNMFIFLY